MDTKKANRFMELEGLRGYAALIVVLYHYLLAFYIVMFGGTGGGNLQHMRLEDNMYANPLMVFLAGPFSVAIFFVLSGFVLTIGFFQTGKLDIIKKLATKRYLRLMLPALASILLCYVVFKLGLSHVKEVAAVSKTSWLGATWNFKPHLLDAISGGVLGIFTQGQNGYNNVLWTMQTEFIGSFIVFGFAALFSKVHLRWVLYIALAIPFFNTWLLPFVAGMVLADLYANGYIKEIKRMALAIPIVLLGLYFGGYPVGNTDHTFYQLLTIPGVDIKLNETYLTIGAVILVFATLSIVRLKKFFQHRYMSILGKYSFSLYLVHLVLLYSVTTFLFVQLRQHTGLGYNTAVLLSILATIPVIVGVTYVFECYIDAPAIRFSSHVANVILGNEPLQVPARITVLSQKLASGWSEAKVRIYAVADRFRKPEVVELDYVLEENEAE